MRIAFPPSLRKDWRSDLGPGSKARTAVGWRIAWPRASSAEFLFDKIKKQDGRRGDCFARSRYRCGRLFALRSRMKGPRSIRSRYCSRIPTRPTNIFRRRHRKHHQQLRPVAQPAREPAQHGLLQGPVKDPLTVGPAGVRVVDRSNDSTRRNLIISVELIDVREKETNPGRAIRGD
jgi:hypothetical protein